MPPSKPYRPPTDAKPNYHPPIEQPTPGSKRKRTAKGNSAYLGVRIPEELEERWLRAAEQACADWPEYFQDQSDVLRHLIRVFVEVGLREYEEGPRAETPSERQARISWKERHQLAMSDWVAAKRTFEEATGLILRRIPGELTVAKLLGLLVPMPASAEELIKVLHDLYGASSILADRSGEPRER